MKHQEPWNKFKEKDVVKKLNNFKLKLLSSYKGYDNKIKVKCRCGKIFKRNARLILTGHTKSCGCCWRMTGKHSNRWLGFGEIGKEFFNTINSNAKVRGLKISVTMPYIWDLFLKQERKCKISGVKLKFGKSRRDRTQNASLDRIDSNKGYIKGNVQWLDKNVNYMKQNMSDKEFINWCKIICRYNEGLK